VSAVILTLYALCLIFLPTFAGFVLVKDWHNPLNRHFAYLCLALFGWVATLFAFLLPLSPHDLLWVGRLNFAAIALALTPGYLFVREAAGTGYFAPSVLWAEGWLVALASLLTPLVDRSESIANGVHITAYGVLFPLYVIHCVALLVATLWICLMPPKNISHSVRSQLRFIGLGAATTGVIALVTNILLPATYGNFTLIHVGPVSTILFLAAVGSATFVHHLFDVHVIIRATVVYAGLIALALEVYSLALSALAKLLPLGAPGVRETAATAIVLVVNAFTQEPIKTWLESVVGIRANGAKRQAAK